MLSGEMDTCQRCVSARGLCRRHARGVLPQLAQPFWYKLVGTIAEKSAHEQVLETMGPEARKVYHRKRTKAARKAARAAQMQTARAASLASLCDAAAA